MTTSEEEIEKAKLNLETAQMAWSVLQVFFASGNAISVSPNLDLVEVAFQMSQDNKQQIESWMAEGKVGQVSDDQARTWYETDAQLWTVVVRPWVLVQDR